MVVDILRPVGADETATKAVQGECPKIFYNHRHQPFTFLRYDGVKMPGEDLLNQKALTDEKFWDEAWSDKKKKKRVLKSYHPYFGKNGIFMKMIRRHVKDLDGKSVIELGGGGPNLRLLALHQWAGAKIATIDFSPVGLREVDELFKAHGASLDLHEGDFTTYDFEGRTFDLVVHWGVLEHFTDMVPLLALCRKLLAKDGVMVFSMPNMKSIGAKAWKKWSPQNWDAHIYHGAPDIASACEKSGLRLEEAFHYGYPFLGQASFEKKGVVPKLVGKMQSLAVYSSVVVPFYHAVGHASWSSQRGFRAVPLS